MAKNIVRNYRLSSEEATALREKATQYGMNESEYFRLLITQRPKDYPEIREELKLLINEVNRIGVNINEIVYNNNSQLYREQDKERLIAYMRKVNAALEKVVIDFGNHKNTDDR